MSYFYDYVKSLGDNPIDIYVDMDGVVADYDFQGYKNDGNNPDIYRYKRPVMSSIEPLKEINELENVTLYILSVSRYESQIDGKLDWLSKHMDFIKKENIFILPRDTNDFKKANVLKRDFLQDRLDNDDVNIHIDDSHDVLKILRDMHKNIRLLHVTSLID